MKGKRGVISTIIGVIIVLLLAAVAFATYKKFDQPHLPIGGIACTMEAKICPDGSAVGRTGPNCEFAACPETPSATIQIEEATSTATTSPTVNPSPVKTVGKPVPY